MNDRNIGCFVFARGRWGMAKLEKCGGYADLFGRGSAQVVRLLQYSGYQYELPGIQAGQLIQDNVRNVLSIAGYLQESLGQKRIH